MEISPVPENEFPASVYAGNFVMKVSAGEPGIGGGAICQTKKSISERAVREPQRSFSECGSRVTRGATFF